MRPDVPPLLGRLDHRCPLLWYCITCRLGRWCECPPARHVSAGLSCIWLSPDPAAVRLHPFVFAVFHTAQVHDTTRVCRLCAILDGWYLF
jgi:hypothetical protein